MGQITIHGRTADCGLAAGDHQGRCSWCGTVLPARRRRWCSDECGRAYADNHAWTNAREVAKDRAGYRCERCTASPPSVRLDVHHRDPVDPQHGYGPGCQHHQANLEVLCVKCHRVEHGFMREVERLLVWADGHVSRQLTLPGIAA